MFFLLFCVPLWYAVSTLYIKAPTNLKIMHRDRFRELLRKYADGTCTPRERRFLEEAVLRNPIKGNWSWESEEEKILMGLRIKRTIDKKRWKRQTRARKFWYAGVAASFMVAIGIAWQLFTPWNQTENHRIMISETASLSTDRVRLTLADGSTVNLDSIGDGLVSQSGNVHIRKLDNNQLVYEVVDGISSPADQESMPQNTIHVPNGKQFQLTLPDGTRVWVNTASSLTYPVAFATDERKVQLIGEAYFEVTPNKTAPFKVIANDTEITVTGTHFNVSAYTSDQLVKATLMEGGIDIQNGGRTVTLIPGDQALVYDGGHMEKRKGNLEQALAWKNGYFVFDDMDIVSVMRCVARWYDIRVEVADPIPSKRFGGTFPVAAELDELLTDLEMIGDIEFERKGKEVRIMR